MKKVTLEVPEEIIEYYHNKVNNKKEIEKLLVDMLKLLKEILEETITFYDGLDNEGNVISVILKRN